MTKSQLTNLFAIISDDNPDSLALRTIHRPAHLVRLEALQQEGRLLLAGPFPKNAEEGFLGSLIVASFDSLEQAKLWAEQDPFFLFGIYARSDVRPFRMSDLIRKTLP